MSYNYKLKRENKRYILYFNGEFYVYTNTFVQALDEIIKRLDELDEKNDEKVCIKC